MNEKTNFKGVIPITPTPFTDSGAVDEASIRNLIRYLSKVGVDGIAILGFLGENHKLSGDERRRVLATVREAVADRFPVFVGVRAFGAAGAIEQIEEASEFGGASGVFVAPIDNQNDNVLFGFFKDVAQGGPLPVMLHDYPASFGTILSAELIIRLAQEVPGVIGIKAEDPPVLTKLTRIREAAPDFGIFGGLGGMFFLEELKRGANGIMTGFSYSEVLVDIWQKFTRGDTEGATETFDHYASLFRYEFQPNIGLAFRKHVMKKRGIFASDHIRRPGAGLDEVTAREYEGILGRLGLSLEPHDLA